MAMEMKNKKMNKNATRDDRGEDFKKKNEDEICDQLKKETWM